MVQTSLSKVQSMYFEKVHNDTRFLDIDLELCRTGIAGQNYLAVKGATA